MHRAARAQAWPLLPAGRLQLSGLALLVSAVLLLGLAQFTSIDLWLAVSHFDVATQRFAWRDHWFAAVMMHRWVKVPLILFGATLLLLALSETLWRWPRLQAADRWRLRSSAALALCIPLSISLVKQFSASHCPWSLERYGGQTPYLRLLDALPAGFDPGACFPAGHASSALWLAGLCVWWLPHRPRAAAVVFAAGLAAGLGLGWVQQMRGAHFLSHTLWAVWIAAAWVWALLLAFALAQRPRALPLPSTPQA